MRVGPSKQALLKEALRGPAAREPAAAGVGRSDSRGLRRGTVHQGAHPSAEAESRSGAPGRSSRQSNRLKAPSSRHSGTDSLEIAPAPGPLAGAAEDRQRRPVGATPGATCGGEGRAPAGRRGGDARWPSVPDGSAAEGGLREAEAGAGRGAGEERGGPQPGAAHSRKLRRKAPAWRRGSKPMPRRRCVVRCCSQRSGPPSRRHRCRRALTKSALSAADAVEPAWLTGAGRGAAAGAGCRCRGWSPERVGRAAAARSAGRWRGGGAVVSRRGAAESGAVAPDARGARVAGAGALAGTVWPESVAGGHKGAKGFSAAHPS